MGACVSKNPTGSKENTGSGKNEAALKTVSERIPLDKTPEGKKKRIDLFKQFDTDGDGKLSHDDLHRGCRDVLKLGEVTNRLPDITKRAYNRACGLATRVKGVGCDKSVEFNEFRYFLSLVRDYFDLTVMFDGIDTSGNMLVEYAEFLQAVPKLNKWGAKIEDPDAAFKSIDGNGSGVVTFDEFAIWASSNRLELSGDKGESPDNNDSNACRDGASTTHEKMEALKTVSERIPLDKTPEGKKKRIDLFKQFDTDGDGKLSHDDLHRGCRDVLKLGEVTNRLPDITKRAYNRACGLATRVKGVGCDESVEFNEFRYFLSLVRDYFDLTVMFDGIDTSGNMLVEYAEFLQAVPKLNKWGAKIEDPDAAFKSIDGNGSGVVTFDEFAIWASSNRLELSGDKGESPDNNDSNACRDGASTTHEKMEALKTVSERIPLDKTPEGKKKRIDLFKQFDTDGDGKLSHDDLHRGCRDVLKLGEVTNRLPDITKRAYNRACGLATRVKGVGCDESVEFNEFRYFLSLVRDYFDLTVMFDGIDTSGNMLVEYAEFLQAVPKLNEWGAKIEDPDAAFKSIDGNGSGVVTFDEFAIWASSNRLDLRSPDASRSDIIQPA